MDHNQNPITDKISILSFNANLIFYKKWLLNTTSTITIRIQYLKTTKKKNDCNSSWDFILYILVMFAIKFLFPCTLISKRLTWLVQSKVLCSLVLQQRVLRGLYNKHPLLHKYIGVHHHFINFELLKEKIVFHIQLT